MHNLLTSNVRPLREDLKPRPSHIDIAVAQSIPQGRGLRYSRLDLTLGNKYYNVGVLNVVRVG